MKLKRVRWKKLEVEKRKREIKKRVKEEYWDYLTEMKNRKKFRKSS